MKLVSIVILLFFINSVGLAAEKNLLQFDRESKTGVREFQSAERCREVPCIIFSDGALQFSEEAQKKFIVEFGYFHEGQISSIEIFEAASALDAKLSERLFYQRQNRSVFHLGDAVNEGKIKTVYIYGVGLHYPLDEGDFIMVTFTDRKNLKQKRRYYFRYHQAGMVWDLDVALATPLKFYRPNPNGVIRGGHFAAAFSFTMGWYVDPEKENSFSRKFIHAWKLNFLTGFLARDELVNRNVDQFVDTKFDGFVGAGFTFLDFIVVGYGVNLFQSPHATFPFAGIEVKNTYDFFRSLKQSTNKKWLRYLAEQKKRE